MRRRIALLDLDGDGVDEAQNGAGVAAAFLAFHAPAVVALDQPSPSFCDTE